MLRALDSTLRTGERGSSVRRSAWICTAAGWALFAIVLAARSVSGAFSAPNAWTALLCSLIASVGAVGLTAKMTDSARVSGERLGLQLGFAIVLFLFTAAISVSFLSLPGLLALWAPALFALAIIGANAFRAKLPAEVLANDEVNGERATRDGETGKGAAWQETARYLAADGKDVIEGRVTVRIPAGERAAISHISFCPPFGGVPRFAFSTEGDTPVRIKLGQLLPQGARLEARIETFSSAPVEARIRFSAEEVGAMELMAAGKREAAQG